MAGYGNPSTDLTAWRVNPDGLLDPSLGGDGIVEADFGEFDYGYAAALQANGKIVAAGHTTVGGNLLGASRSSASSRAARWTPPSAPTASRRVNVEGDDAAYGMALQPNGRIVVAGEAAANVAGARLEGDASGSGGGPVGGGPGDPRGSSSVPRCAGRRATIVGTSQRDVLRGTRRSDVIAALAGNDRIRAASQGTRAATASSARTAATGCGAAAARIASEVVAAATAAAAAPATTGPAASPNGPERGPEPAPASGGGDAVQPCTRGLVGLAAA